MVSMSKRQKPHRDENCLLKATDWSSINDKESLIHVPPGGLQLASKLHYIQVLRNTCSCRFQKHKSKLKIKKKPRHTKP